MKNKIILSADTEFKDNELRDIVEQLITKFDTLNERTKRLTLEIRELNKKIKKNE